MALTEKYVSSSAGGGGTGLTSGSPLTLSEMVAAINAGTEAGSRFNLLVGTYTRSATDTISGSGTSTSPVIIRGYSSAIGDAYLGRTNGNGALIVTNMPLLSYNSTFQLSCTGAFIILEGIQATGARSGPICTISTNSFVRGCRFSNSSTNAAATALTCNGSPSLAFDSDCTLTGVSGGICGLLLGQASACVIGCRVKVTSTAPGIASNINNGRHVVAFNTVFASGGPALASITATTIVFNALFNTFVGCAGDGISIFTGSTLAQTIIGNMVTDNGGYGINLVSAANAAFLAYNRTRDNTSGAINLGTDWVAATNYGAVTAGAGISDFVNAAANDYNLIVGSPAVGAGIPQFASIGALQRPQAGAGGISRGRML